MSTSIEGGVDCFVNGYVSGWVRRPGSPERFEICVRVNGVEMARTRADRPRADLVQANIGDGHHGFLVAIDRSCLEGTGPLTVTAIAIGADESVMLHPGPMVIETNDGFGYLDELSQNFAYGWVAPRLPNAPAVAVELLIDGKPCLQAKPTRIREDLAHFQLDNRPTGFALPLPADLLDGTAHRVEVRVVGTGTMLRGAPRTFEPKPAAPASHSPEATGAPIAWHEVGRALDGVAEQLLAHAQQALQAGEQPSAANEWVRRVLVPELLRSSRARPVDCRLPTPAEGAGTEADDGVTDIVIPVYRGFEETLACIMSVVESAGDSPQEIVVIDDHTPDPELAAELARLEQNGLITRLVHLSNRGFVASANAGMALHPHRDVVLLNSDTVVPHGWLDRMRRAAYAGPTIGTVTPFSNRATICGFPAMPGDNDLPPGWTVQELDDAFARHNAGLVVDIPTAVGFCMYIRRAVIRDTGFLDEATWGRGYGEENDYCLRSAARGWRHVQACDVFVQHDGSVSFSGEKAELIKAHLATLNRLYPDYAARVAHHLKTDPAAPARHRVLKDVYLREAAVRMLFITHALGGGTQVVVETLTGRLAQENVASLVLAPQSEDRWRLSRPGDNYGLDYCMPDDFSKLLADVSDLGVWHVHCHHLAGLGSMLPQFLEELPVSYDVSVHDYMWVCPRVTLLDGNNRYCGEPETDACDRCISQVGVFPQLKTLFEAFAQGTASWRRLMFRILRRARRVIVPSEDVASRLGRYVELDNLVLRPHPEVEGFIEVPARAPSLALNVAVIGAIGMHKGMAMLSACAAEADVRGLNLKFTVIGYTWGAPSLSQCRNVSVTGHYAREQVQQLARAHQCDIALFLSPWPETFSYTLSEALQAGLYPVVPDLGAPSERVRQAGFGETYPLESTPGEILERLLAIGARGVPAARYRVGCDYGTLLSDYYGLARPTGREATPPGGAVCVLGMHRSGTSTLAGALEASGLNAGEVLRFGMDNVKGHIESRLVIAINDAVLQRSGGSWREVPEVLRWTEAEQRRRDAFVAAHEARGGTWLFKDPRTLLTLPFWREALPRLSLVGSFRHPLKVAFSLFQRDGMALDEGLRLWTAYTRRLVACWEEEAFPLLCFDLPEGAYRTAVSATVESLGTQIDAPLNGAAAVEFFSAQLRAAAIPKALLQDTSGGVADDLAAALDLYAQLLTCAGIDHRLLIHTHHCLPLSPTIEHCRQLLAEAPDNVMVLTLLASLLERAGEPEAACATRRELVQLAPHNYLALRALLDSLAGMELHSEALVLAKRALLTHPDNPDLHFWLGNTILRQGDFPAAAPHFRMARDADYAYLSCARELATQGDTAR